MNFELSPQDAGSIPVILGLVEVLKYSGLPVKYAPIASLILGVLYGLTMVSQDVPGAIMGLVAGLSASGLFDHSKGLISR